MAPVEPADPVAPKFPCGIPKFSTAAVGLPEFVTVTEDPAAPVETVPTATVVMDGNVPSVPSPLKYWDAAPVKFIHARSIGTDGILPGISPMVGNVAGFEIGIPLDGSRDLFSRGPGDS